MLAAAQTPLGTPARKLRAPGTPLGTPARKLRAPGTPLGTPVRKLRAPGTPLARRDRVRGPPQLQALPPSYRFQYCVLE
jgi:hypothetical protein